MWVVATAVQPAVGADFAAALTRQCEAAVHSKVHKLCAPGALLHEQLFDVKFTLLRRGVSARRVGSVRAHCRVLSCTTHHAVFSIAQVTSMAQWSGARHDGAAPGFSGEAVEGVATRAAEATNARAASTAAPGFGAANGQLRCSAPGTFACMPPDTATCCFATVEHATQISTLRPWASLQRTVDGRARRTW